MSATVSPGSGIPLPDPGRAPKRTDEIARLANIALADTGFAETVYVADGSVCGAKGTGVEGRKAERKAMHLATSKLLGPDYAITCPAHDTLGVTSRCAKVPVRDALMGRSCGVS